MHPKEYEKAVSREYDAGAAKKAATERGAAHERPERSFKRLLSRDEIEAEYGHPTKRWLELAAHRGDGPPMLKISRRMVRYDRAEFEAWLDAQRVDNPDTAA